MVALTGGSSNHASLLRRLATDLTTLLRRRPRQHKHRNPRQVQRRLRPRQVEQLVAEYETGASIQALAKRWRLHRTTVAEHLHRADVEIRQRGIPTDQRYEVIRLYEKGWSCLRLAERFDCDDETVRQTLKRAGVKLRPPWERA
jgi:DNA-directed RNA polymerase specialized sigma24 family protein